MFKHLDLPVSEAKSIPLDTLVIWDNVSFPFPLSHTELGFYGLR